MNRLCKTLLAACVGSLIATSASAISKALQPLVAHRFSAGPLFGYGTTNWSMLSAYCQGDEDCLNTVSASAPVSAEDKGFLWGLHAGYQIVENFGVEAVYRRFHNSIINFGIYTFYDKLPPETPSQITSSVYAYSLMGKFYAPLFGSRFYAYAAIGPTVTHRNDILTERTHVNLSFGMGFGSVFWKQFQANVAFFYATGYDHPTTTPAESYTPFLLTVELELAYLF